LSKLNGYRCNFCNDITICGSARKLAAKHNPKEVKKTNKDFEYNKFTPKRFLSNEQKDKKLDDLAHTVKMLNQKVVRLNSKITNLTDNCI